MATTEDLRDKRAAMREANVLGARWLRLGMTNPDSAREAFDAWLEAERHAAKAEVLKEAAILIERLHRPGLTSRAVVICDLVEWSERHLRKVDLDIIEGKGEDQ